MKVLALLGLAALAEALPLSEPVPSQNRPRSTSGKRGLAYTSASQANQFFSGSEHITWGYNWGDSSQGLSSEFEYVPMLYGNPDNNPQYIQSWQGNASAAIEAGSQHLLAFNEPDINGLSPAEAAASYKKYMQPFASSKVKLGAPAVTNGGPPTGLTWLGQFLGNCTDCTIDFVPFHWYCQYNNIEYFTNYVEEAYAAGGHRPLWLTEFGSENADCSLAATDSQQSQFLETVLPWLDSLDYVERYAYFGAIESSSENTYMLNEAGTELTQNGQTYISQSNVNSTTPTSLVN